MSLMKFLSGLSGTSFIAIVATNALSAAYHPRYEQTQHSSKT